MNLTSFSCIVCSKDMRALEPTSKPESGMWNEGSVTKMTSNYGSDYDGDEYLIGVCDDCLETKIRQGMVKYLGNYMFPPTHVPY